MKLPYITLRWMPALLALLLFQTSYAGHHPGLPQTSGKALGVTIHDVPFEALAAAELDYGVRIVGVMPGSAAATGGLEKDDIIVEINQKPVYSVRRLQWLVRLAPEGTPVPIKFQREDKLETVSVTFHSAKYPEYTGEGHPGTGHPGKGHPGVGERQFARGSFLGVQLQPMTQQLRAAFGSPTDKGVLVAGLAEDGPAVQAGLAVGDVIVRMDRKTITDVRDIHRVLAYFDPEDEIEVEVIRDEASQNLTARLGAMLAPMPHLPRHGYPHFHPYGRP